MPDSTLAQIFIALVVLLFSLTVHESAHAWTADRLGDPTGRLLGRVSLNPLVHIDPIGTLVFPIIAALSGVPLIGWAKPVPVNLGALPRGRRDFMLVAAAGPCSNLLIAGVAAAGLRVLPWLPASAGEVELAGPLVMLAARTLELNVLLAVFNLVPVPPLDGGNVLWGLLPERAAYRLDQLRPYSFVLIYALVFSGWLSPLITRPYHLILSWLL